MVYDDERNRDNNGDMNGEEGSDKNKGGGGKDKDNPGNFANDPERAKEAGRQGSQN